MGIESIFLLGTLALWAAGFRLRDRLRPCAATHPSDCRATVRRSPAPVGRRCWVGGGCRGEMSMVCIQTQHTPARCATPLQRGPNQPVELD